MTELRKLAEQVRKEAPFTAFGATVTKFCDLVAAVLDGHEIRLNALGDDVSKLRPEPVKDGE